MTCMVKVTETGCGNPGALRVSTLLLYCPDWLGAWTVTVRIVVPGAMSPTEIALLEVEIWVLVPQFTAFSHLTGW